jgi:hypothetical protein
MSQPSAKAMELVSRFRGFNSDRAKARFYEAILEMIGETPDANPEQTAALARDAIILGAKGNHATH